MRKFVTVFAAAALAVGGVSLLGCGDTMDTTTDGTTPGTTSDPAMDMPADGTNGIGTMEDSPAGATTAPAGTAGTPAP